MIMATKPFDLQKALDGHPLIARDGSHIAEDTALLRQFVLPRSVQSKSES